MAKYLEVVELHPRGYPERIASDIANDPEAIAFIAAEVGGGGGAVTESGTTPGAAALADDATPDGALDVRITALEETPGGASPIIESDWVPFTDAEIKGWPTAVSRTIVEAPGAGKFFQFHGAAVLLDTTAGPYGNVNAGAAMTFEVGTKPASTSTVEPFTTNMFEAEEKTLAFIAPTNPPPTGNLSLTAAEDGAIVLVWTNPVDGDFTDGNALNTLKVKVWYTEVAFS
jgi:hypothetical protein